MAQRRGGIAERVVRDVEQTVHMPRRMEAGRVGDTESARNR